MNPRHHCPSCVLPTFGASGRTRSFRADSWTGSELTGSWQTRYSWLSPEHGSSPGNLAGSGQPECGRNTQGLPPCAIPSTLPPQPHPHSSWILGIKGHGLCGRSGGVARTGRGRREVRTASLAPPTSPPHPTPPHRMQRRLRTETPRPQELEQRVQDPHGVHSPGPYLGRQGRVSLEGS